LRTKRCSFEVIFIDRRIFVVDLAFFLRKLSGILLKKFRNFIWKRQRETFCTILLDSNGRGWDVKIYVHIPKPYNLSVRKAIVVRRFPCFSFACSLSKSVTCYVHSSLNEKWIHERPTQISTPYDIMEFPAKYRASKTILLKLFSKPDCRCKWALQINFTNRLATTLVSTISLHKLPSRHSLRDIDSGELNMTFFFNMFNIYETFLDFLIIIIKFVKL